MPRVKIDRAGLAERARMIAVLREAIIEDRRPIRDLATLTEVTAENLHSALKGKSGLSVETIGRLLRVLGKDWSLFDLRPVEESAKNII